jgi:hypothetical protein
MAGCFRGAAQSGRGAFRGGRTGAGHADQAPPLRRAVATFTTVAESFRANDVFSTLMLRILADYSHALTILRFSH